MTSFKEDGRTYYWYNGFGSLFHSNERGVQLGDVRVIKGTLFYAYTITRGWFYNEIHWTVMESTVEEIKRIKAKMFNVY